jgi:hypothetical protein
MQHHLSAKVAPTLPTSDGRSVGIVRSRTKAMEFVLFVRFFFFALDIDIDRYLQFLGQYPVNACAQITTI